MKAPSPGRVLLQKHPEGTAFFRASCRKKFTLIELLIVIAIIVILAGMLLPALKEARNYAYRADCTGRLRQIAGALHSYVGDNKDYFPALGMYPYEQNGVSANLNDGTWYGGLGIYLGDLKANTNLVTRKGFINRETSLRKKNVAYCQSPSSPKVTGGGSTWSPTYTYNSNHIMASVPTARIGNIPSSSSYFIFADGYYLASPDTINFYSSESISVWDGISKTVYLPRIFWVSHNGNASFAFLDGHVSVVNERRKNPPYNDWISNRQAYNGAPANRRLLY